MSALNLRVAERETELSYLESAKRTLAAQATLPCLDWILSESDSDVEKRAEEALDEVFEGGIDYRAACQFVLN